SSFVNPYFSFAAVPRLKILDGGKHGGSHIVHDKVFPIFKRSNPRFKCNGRKVEGAVISQTPASDSLDSRNLILSDPVNLAPGV
ncbi:hypothetical protein AB9F35_34330, partial [Rhizobium leguminosarum]